MALSFTVVDPGADDVLGGRVRWGDGSADRRSGSPVTATHRYGVGSHVITVEAEDDDGGTRLRGSTAGAVRLQYRATGAGAATGGGPVVGATTLRQGSDVPLAVDVRDCDGHPVAGPSPVVGAVRWFPGPKQVIDTVRPATLSSSDRMAPAAGGAGYAYVLSTRRSGSDSGGLMPGTFRVTASDPSFGTLGTTIRLTRGP